MAAIEVRDLTMKYQQREPGEVRALDAVTLTIHASEFVSVVGRAGSGKTTLLHCLSLLVRPTAGQVLIEGADTTKMTDAQRAALRGRRLGFVLQHPTLLPALTVLENVTLPLRYAWIDRSAKRRARDLLDLVGLGDRAGDRPDQLGPGQAQRAAIARALIRSPAIVLADEPTGEVDNETSDELLYLMQQVNRASGVTFVIGTHDLEVGSCMDRVIRLSDGRVVSDERARNALNRVREVR